MGKSRFVLVLACVLSIRSREVTGQRWTAGSSPDPAEAPSSLGAVLRLPLTVQEARDQRIRGINRVEEPVTVGIPLPDSAGIISASELGLSGASAGQFRIIGRWPSGNVKWVLVDTLASVPAGRNDASIALTRGAGNFGGLNLATDTGPTIRVNTGSAGFTIRKANFDLFDQVTVDADRLLATSGENGLVVVGPPPERTTCPCATDYSSSNDPKSTGVIEENGPVRAVVKALGQFLDKSGRPYMRFTVRLHFYKGQSYAKAVVTLQNADYGSSKSFATAYKGFSAFEARLTPSLATSRSFSVGTSQSPVGGALTSAQSAYLYQAYSNDLEDCDWINPDPRSDPRPYIARTLVAQNGCQSSNWQYAQEGYRVANGGATLASGTRSQYAAGWADLTDSSGAGVEVGVYQLAAYWPKSLQFMNGGNEIRIGIWPDQSLYGSGGQQYIQAWPQYSVHTLYFNFHNQALSSPGDEFTKFQAPLIARASLDTYNTAGVFPYPILAASDTDNFYKSLGMACCIRDREPHVYRTYGWKAGGGGNQTEWRWADLLLWLQRGYAGRYLNSAHFYTFQTEQAFARSDYNGATPFNWRDSFVPAAMLGPGRFPENVTSLNNNIGCDTAIGAKTCGGVDWVDPEHAHWYGMIDYYFMTGDESVREAIEDGATDVYGNPNTRFVQGGYYWNTRAIGVALMSAARLKGLYSAIGDMTGATNALAAGAGVLAKQVWPELSVSGYGLATQGVSRTRGVHYGCCDLRQGKPFMNGILNEGLWEYLQAQGPSWPQYGLTFDLADGVANWTMSEAYRTNGTTETSCNTGSAFAYEVSMDNPNNPLYPDCDATTWFNSFIGAKYGDTNFPWQSEFEANLKHFAPNNFFDEYGTIFIDAVIHEILNPGPVLVDVPLSVTGLGNGSYTLTWTVPAGVKSYRIKYSGKKIVDWIGFDPVGNTFTGDPSTTWPWFAASEISSLPAPGPAGTIQTYTVSGLDPGKKLSFALRAYIPYAAPPRARSGRHAPGDPETRRGGDVRRVVRGVSAKFVR